MIMKNKHLIKKTFYENIVMLSNEWCFVVWRHRL